MKAKKTAKPPYRSVKKLQTYFENLNDYNAYPLGDYIELGADGVYHSQTNH